MTYDAVVLAGGAGSRLGGLRKPTVAVGGRRLIDISLDALAGAGMTVAVGAAVPTARPVVWTCEDPPGGGPVAALAAALRLIQAAAVVVLAADLPFITESAVDRLSRERGHAAGAVAIDGSGRDQPLVACYDTSRLLAALPDDPRGASMRSILGRLESTGTLRRVDLGGDPPVTWDCDTAEDLTQARELA